MKRLFNLSSPLGIAITVAGVVLALSPEARKTTRRMLVKGTALMLGAFDQAKHATSDLAADLTTNEFVDEQMDTKPHPEYH